jgi:hypothetical protein
LSSMLKNHFSESLSDEKLLECAFEIVTNPKISWKQITGQDHGTCRPSKYIADGEIGEKAVRVVFEPKGYKVLALYPRV